MSISRKPCSFLKLAGYRCKFTMKEEVKLEVSYNEYNSHLVDQCAFNIACLATVQDTNYEYFAQDDFRVRKPDIKIKIERTPIHGQEFNATASFVNPLPVQLKKGQFMIEGPGLKEQLKIKFENNIPPNGEAKASFKLTPPFPGRSTIAGKFVSKELDDVEGFINFMVQEKPPPNGDTNGLSNNVPT